MNEFLPKDYQATATTYLNIGDSMNLVIQCFYFDLISNNWIYLHGFGILWVSSLIYGLLRIPESPKFLYTNGRFDETREVLAQIAIHNGI